MNIGVVTTSYPRGPKQFAGAFVAEHVAWLRERGHRVEVIAAGAGDVAVEPGRFLFHAGAPEALEPGRFLFHAGAPEALEPGRRAGLAWLSALGFSARMLAAVRRSARDWDRVFAHWLVPSAVCAAIAGRGAPLVAIAHSGDVHLLVRTRLATPVIAVLERRGVSLCFVSEQLRDRLAGAVVGARLRRYVDSAAICAMGIDAARFDRLPSETRTRKTALFLGRLVPVKGPQVLIDAAAQLGDDVDVVVAGDGPLRERLQSRGRARFVGRVAFDERHELIASADVVVVPSIELDSGRSEGTPVAALEAMAAGVPVVASAVGGLAALPVAARVPPGDPAALAAAIGQTLASPPDVSEARAYARAHDWSRVGPRLDRLFR